MLKVFTVVFVIFGTVVGSGFASGKEILVFFSQFGNLSYLFITLAGVLFFLLFYIFLRSGKRLTSFFEQSKWLNLCMVFISIIFCASMFAGMKSLFEFFGDWLYIVCVSLMLVCAVLVTIRGVKGFEKLNCILMPATSLIFLVVLFYAQSLSSNVMLVTDSWAGILYAPLYVALNTSMSAVVVAKVGDGMNKKQTFVASLFSVLLLLAFLFLGNFVLQKNSASFSSEMPFLFLVRENKYMFSLTFFVILVGCFTTLISQCLTVKSAFEKCFKNESVASVFAVFLPFAISSLGFSQIVSFLYPICSVLAIFVLGFELFFIFTNTKREKHILS